MEQIGNAIILAASITAIVAGYVVMMVMVWQILAQWWKDR